MFRPLDDPNYVAVDLEFDTPAEAERCKVALGELWRSKQAVPALRGAPQVRIVETVESVQYWGRAASSASDMPAQLHPDSPVAGRAG